MGESVGVGRILGVISSDPLDEAALSSLRLSETHGTKIHNPSNGKSERDDGFPFTENLSAWNFLAAATPNRPSLVLIGGGNGALQVLNIL